MSRTLICARRELPLLQEAFSRAAVVSRTPFEDLDGLRKFKYACGKNYETVRRLLERIVTQQQAMVRPNPDFQKFQRAQNELALKHCLKDKDEPQYHTDPKTGECEYRFTTAGELAMQAELDRLQATYATALAARKRNAEEIEAYLDGTVELELYTFPYDNVPELVAGGFLAAISPMLEGAPTAGNHEFGAYVLRERTLPLPHWFKRMVARWCGLALVPGYSGADLLPAAAEQAKLPHVDKKEVDGPTKGGNG